MANKISVIIEASVDKANTALAGFRKSVADADGATAKFKAGSAASFASLQANAGTAALAAGAAIVTFGAKAVAAASQLEESTNAVNKSFGQAAEDVLDIGENAAESFGLSQSAFNAAAVSFSSFAQTVSGPGGDVAETLTDLTTRAADFASVMNIDVAEASTVFRSGLSGETEPLKKFGIDLSAAAVEAYALSSGLVKSKGEMTEAIKVQARYGLLMQSTSKFAGDFADTSDGLANSSRVLGARVEDLSARIGGELTPSIAVAVGWALKLLDVFEALGWDIPLFPVDLEESNSKWADYNELLELAASGNERAKQAILDGKSSLDLSTAAVERSTNAVARNTATNVDQQKAILASAAGVEAATAATDVLTEAQELNTDRLNEAREAQEAATEAALEAIDASLNYRNQQNDTNQTIARTSLEMAIAGEGTKAYTDAALEQEGAALDQAAAAVRLAEDQAAANGETLTANEKTAIYKAELEKLAGYLNGDAALAIALHVDALRKIPKSIATDITVRATAGYRGSTGVVTGRAGGGTTGMGEVTLVGEEGPEIARFPTGTQITPARQTAAMLGGNTYNIYGVPDAQSVRRELEAMAWKAGAR